MESIILDPDFENFYSVYAGEINITPPTEKYNYTKIIFYIKDNNKVFGFNRTLPGGVSPTLFRSLPRVLKI